MGGLTDVNRNAFHRLECIVEREQEVDTSAGLVVRLLLGRGTDAEGLEMIRDFGRRLEHTYVDEGMETAAEWRESAEEMGRVFARHPALKPFWTSVDDCYELFRTASLIAVGCYSCDSEIDDVGVCVVPRRVSFGGRARAAAPATPHSHATTTLHVARACMQLMPFAGNENPRAQGPSTGRCGVVGTAG